MTARCFAFFTLFHLSLTFFRPEVPFKDFKFDLFKPKEPVERLLPSNKSIKYTTIPFIYDGKEAPIKLDGVFRSFTNFNDGKPRTP